MGEVSLGSTEQGLVAPSRTAVAATPAIKKDWKWFIPVVCIIKGPIYLDHLYRAVILATDENGFPYPPVTSAEVRVTVGVATHKWLAAKFSQGAAATAAILIASIVGAAAGAALYAAAVAAGEVALDPPEPDLNFRALIPLPPLGEVLTTGPDRNIMMLARLSERIMRIELAKSFIEGRRLDVVAANDSQWVQVHADSLVAATALQRSLADQVRDIEAWAKQDIQTLIPPGADVRQVRLNMQANGLSADLADRMDLPTNQRDGIDALLRSDLAVESVDIIEAFDAAVEPLTSFTEQLE